jgi:4-hydroxybenzoate polyprenyltransferase
MSWLNLVRWKNLLIIFATQLSVWLFVLLPEQRIAAETTTFLLNTINFLCVSGSTVLIAAAGYIINDYFDVKIDLINRPATVILGNDIPRKTAIYAHAALNIAALLLSGFVAMQVRHYEWPLLQLVCIALLWLYSTRYKRQYVIGNIVVALLTALTIIILIVYEPELHTLFSLPVWVLGVYSYFAFMLTWMREIVKDMEDFKGDAADGCVTLPIKKGLKYAAGVVTAISVFAVIPLAVAPFVLFVHRYQILALYIAVLLSGLVSWTIAFARNRDSRNYHSASRWLKIIMVAGIGSLLIYYIEHYVNRG